MCISMEKFVVYTLLVYSFFFSSEAGASKIDLVKVSNGNTIELNNAFERRAKSDGADSEELDVAIGKSISKNPNNFLKVFQSHKPSIKRLDSLLCNLGLEYVDRIKDQEHEFLYRIASFKKVKEKKLKSSAIECISQLQKCLLQIKRK
jgi:hypothetical protein